MPCIKVRVGNFENTCLASITLRTYSSQSTYMYILKWCHFSYTSMSKETSWIPLSVEYYIVVVSLNLPSVRFSTLLLALQWLPTGTRSIPFASGAHTCPDASEQTSSTGCNISTPSSSSSSDQCSLTQVKPLQCWGYFCPKDKDAKSFEKTAKPCHVGMHWIALAECSQMSTYVPGFQSFLRFFASFCIGQISHHQHRGYVLWPAHA